MYLVCEAYGDEAKC